MKSNKNLISIEFINKIVDNKINKEEYIEITNIYIKEKIKSMCHSQEFKELTPFRGPQKLIEYLKDIWMVWVDLIYNASSGVKYFTTMGAENDFEWVKDNPFNEIKKYERKKCVFNTFI